MSDSPCRHVASALLPWYANGALGPEQHAMVREHVEECDTCAVELAGLEEAARSAAPPVFTREPEPRTESRTRAGRTLARSVWLLAVVLGVPAILGLVWVVIEVVRGR